MVPAWKQWQARMESVRQPLVDTPRSRWHDLRISRARDGSRRSEERATTADQRVCRHEFRLDWQRSGNSAVTRDRPACRKASRWNRDVRLRLSVRDIGNHCHARSMGCCRPWGRRSSVCLVLPFRDVSRNKISALLFRELNSPGMLACRYGGTDAPLDPAVREEVAIRRKFRRR